MRHQEQPEHVQQRAAQYHAPRAVLVGEHAGERLRRAPHQVLHGECEREGLAAPVHVGRDRLQEEPEAVADAHGEREDQAAAHEDDGGRAPVGYCAGR